jgi:hypothetical protein
MAGQLVVDVVDSAEAPAVVVTPGQPGRSGVGDLIGLPLSACQLGSGVGDGPMGGGQSVLGAVGSLTPVAGQPGQRSDAVELLLAQTKPLSFREKKMLERARYLLVSELAMATVLVAGVGLAASVDVLRRRPLATLRAE